MLGNNWSKTTKNGLNVYVKKHEHSDIYARVLEIKNEENVVIDYNFDFFSVENGQYWFYDMSEYSCEITFDKMIEEVEKSINALYKATLDYISLENMKSIYESPCFLFDTNIEDTQLQVLFKQFVNYNGYQDIFHNEMFFVDETHISISGEEYLEDENYNSGIKHMLDNNIVERLKFEFFDYCCKKYLIND